ncbi:BTAD domain-containing putative transcriptional regulator [Nocardioides terrigena]|uniref:BTAD domain-containing putative transcriptional regulator n=1 Tax=Nocardioides terrigena TaxID=424797 RepID=UPI000D3133C2|nr:BTAD domain-containing putative transcriptional regulator [Nocardioides terrigena]
MTAISQCLATVHVDLLGPVQVRVDDQVVAAGGPKLRAIVAMLALAGGRTVSVDDLLDGVWGENLPATARNTLQYHVAVLRKTLTAHGAGGRLTTRDPGYALTVETDATRFASLAASGTRAAAADDHEQAAASYAAALDVWQGNALADLREFEFAVARAVALEGQRLTCAEAWADAELACGRADAIVSALHDLVTENPTRERLWEQLMVALYRTGRQDAALSAYRSARQALDRELGVEPSARLVAVQQAILCHDPRLAPVPAQEPGGRPVRATSLVASGVPGSPPMLTGHGGVKVALTGAPVVLGRHGDCDLVLADEQASRRHAQVEAGADGFVLVDLGSTNGTYLNGTAVKAPVALTDGDTIVVGHTVVRFSAARDLS